MTRTARLWSSRTPGRSSGRGPWRRRQSGVWLTPAESVRIGRVVYPESTPNEATRIGRARPLSCRREFVPGQGGPAILPRSCYSPSSPLSYASLTFERASLTHEPRFLAPREPQHPVFRYPFRYMAATCSWVRKLSGIAKPRHSATPMAEVE